MSLLYCYSNNCVHPLVQLWTEPQPLAAPRLVYDLEHNPRQTVIILANAEPALIEQVHELGRGQDLMVVVLGSANEYYNYALDNIKHQVRQSMLVRCLHQTHVHNGVQGPWLVHVRCAPDLDWISVRSMIDLMSENRMVCRIQDILLTKDPGTR